VKGVERKEKRTGVDRKTKGRSRQKEARKGGVDRKKQGRLE